MFADFPHRQNVTIALIVNDHLICTAFDRLNHYICWQTIKYACVQATDIQINSLQDNAANVTAGKMWNVLNMNNICISAVRASQDSDSKLFCPWLKPYLPAACLRLFDVRTLPPADSLVTHYQGSRGTSTSHMVTKKHASHSFTLLWLLCFAFGPFHNSLSAAMFRSVFQHWSYG